MRMVTYWMRNKKDASNVSSSEDVVGNDIILKRGKRAQEHVMMEKTFSFQRKMMDIQTKVN